MISFEWISALVGVAGFLIAAAALKSRSSMARKADEAESRTEAVIGKRKTEHEIEMLVDADVAAKFDRLQSDRQKGR